ncbi:hypothetical protein [Burkholderia cepacia]|uniref:hypothetical protein n=1 Tax=Burkholderia cepacia TaxID=292 RepID=UPI001CF3EAF8|nr:hypothetical protein [Burkholderia cepacia]MCA8326111.1 hypothetical protein [Burkholderia cepacia]
MKIMSDRSEQFFENERLRIEAEYRGQNRARLGTGEAPAPAKRQSYESRLRERMAKKGGRS